jgi:hypothetical protein
MVKVVGNERQAEQNTQRLMGPDESSFHSSAIFLSPEQVVALIHKYIKERFLVR